MAQRLRYAELAPDGIAALRQVEHYLNTGTALSPVLLELVRLRASTLNGCDFCLHMHQAELRKHHEPESRIEAVADWHASDAFTPREQAALAYTDAVTNVQEGHVDDGVYAAVGGFFSGKELVDLTMAIAMINAWNRLAIPFRLEWDPKKAAPMTKSVESGSGGEPAALNHGGVMVSAVGDDGGKVAEE